MTSYDSPEARFTSKVRTSFERFPNHDHKRCGDRDDGPVPISLLENLVKLLPGRNFELPFDSTREGEYIVGVTRSSAKILSL